MTSFPKLRAPVPMLLMISHINMSFLWAKAKTLYLYAEFDYLMFL